MNDKSTGFNLDTPLQTASALDDDKMSRKGFSESAANALLKIPATAGLVVSIEGAWGSGKTSVLAMIEAVLRKDVNLPLLDVPLSHRIMRPSIAVPRPSFSQIALG
jgi:predicted KAP-like P-loop ATPase